VSLNKENGFGMDNVLWPFGYRKENPDNPPHL
jgi:hypothetical protein